MCVCIRLCICFFLMITRPKACCVIAKVILVMSNVNFRELVVGVCYDHRGIVWAHLRDSDFTS